MAESRSSSPLLSPLNSQTSLKRPALVKSSGLQESSQVLPYQPPARQVRIETPGNSHSSGEAVDGEIFKTHLQPFLSPLKPDKMLSKRHYHDVTPPEADPSAEGLRHGDHYFRTFGPEPVYMKEFTPTLIPSPERPASARMAPSPIPVIPATLVRTLSHETPTLSQRRRRSIFRAFRKAAWTDSTYEAPNSGIIGTAPPFKPTPGILISEPRTPATGRRKSTCPPDAPSQCYFELAGPSDTSTDSTPSSAKSPMSLSRSGRDLQRSSSGSLSPFTRPRYRPRLQHRRTLESIQDAELPSVLPREPASLPIAAPESQPTLKSFDVAQYYKMSLFNSGALNPLPRESSETEKVSDEHAGINVEGKKRSVVKQFFADMRKPSSAQTKPEPDTPEVVVHKERAGLRPMASMATIIRKASLPQVNKLKRKASQATSSALEHTHLLRSKMSLEVTDFYQTPYGQRYGNTKRADANHIRTLVEDALDDDGDEDVQVGFELGVPDHLPSSPLCPLSPMHKSGGKAICPMHGRKTPSSATAMAINRSATAKVGPRIVYEGKVEAGGWVDAPRRESVEWADFKRARLSQTSDGAWYS
ncbi:hypothetical protein LTR08_003271 [Meristemomyces frigidus]|nr:hypothetical protein LTR08_003271 [Meristemomyces frigidus]